MSRDPEQFLLSSALFSLCCSEGPAVIARKDDKGISSDIARFLPGWGKIKASDFLLTGLISLKRLIIVSDMRPEIKTLRFIAEGLCELLDRRDMLFRYMGNENETS